MLETYENDKILITEISVKEDPFKFIKFANKDFELVNVKYEV